MDIVFLAVFGMFSIVSLIMLLSSLSNMDKDFMKFATIVSSICVSFIVWTVSAMNSLPPESSKTSYLLIEEQRNTVYFQKPNGDFVELRGAYKFIDINKNQIKYTIYGGMWNYGMYVTEKETWDVVPKNVE
jgi:hypothetical protein